MVARPSPSPPRKRMECGWEGVVAEVNSKVVRVSVWKGVSEGAIGVSWASIADW